MMIEWLLFVRRSERFAENEAVHQHHRKADSRHNKGSTNSCGRGTQIRVPSVVEGRGQGKPAALGIADDSGIYGWNFRYGATGFIALDDGYYYLSHNGTTEDKKQTTTVYLYRWTGKAPDAFEPVD